MEGVWTGGHVPQASREPRTLRQRPFSPSSSAVRAVSDISQDVHAQLKASDVCVPP